MLLLTFLRAAFVFYSAHKWDVQTCNFTQGWLNYNSLTYLLCLCILVVGLGVRCIYLFAIHNTVWCTLLLLSLTLRFQHPSISHTHTDVICGLLLNSTMYICVSVAFVLIFLMFNDIRTFRVSVTILCIASIA